MKADPSFTKRRPPVSIAQLLNISVCNIVFSTQNGNNPSTMGSFILGSTIAQFILGTFTCILVMAQFVRHSLQTYQATQWKMNGYMRLLIRDGLLYFLVYVLPLTAG